MAQAVSCVPQPHQLDTGSLGTNCVSSWCQQPCLLDRAQLMHSGHISSLPAWWKHLPLHRRGKVNLPCMSEARMALDISWAEKGMTSYWCEADEGPHTISQNPLSSPPRNRPFFSQYDHSKWPCLDAVLTTGQAVLPHSSLPALMVTLIS